MKGRERHLPDSCLWTSLRKKLDVSGALIVMSAPDMSQVGVALFP